MNSAGVAAKPSHYRNIDRNRWNEITGYEQQRSGSAVAQSCRYQNGDDMLYGRTCARISLVYAVIKSCRS